MCIDRVQANMVPSCVKTCCTGTMNFGERAEMLALAKERLEMLKKTFPRAKLIDPDDVAVIYLVTHPEKEAKKQAGAPRAPMNRRDLLSSLVSPFQRMAG
jgi:formate dehydrogenase iron-sulfur subunit